MWKRRVNWKLLLWLAAWGMALTWAVQVGHSTQMNRHGLTLLRQADQAEEQGQHAQAAEYLRRYLTIRPTDTSALAQYAFELDKTASSRAVRERAANVFEKVLGKDRTRGDVRRRLTDLALELGWIEDALRHARVLAANRPNDGATLVLLGQCYEVQSPPQFEDAAAEYANATTRDKHYVDGWVRLAALQSRLGQSAEAADTIKGLVTENPDQVAAWLEATQFWLAGGKLEEAKNSLAKAQTLAPDDPAVLRMAADVAQRRGDLVQAREWWLKAQAASPENIANPVGLATLELQQRRPAAAYAVLVEALRRAPADAELIFLLTESLLQQGKLAEARQFAADHARKAALPGLADLLEARVLLREGKPMQAAQLLEDTARQIVLTPEVAAHVLLCLGEAYQQTGNSDRQLVYYREAVRFGPALPRARVQLGATLLEQGATQEAIAELREATRLPLPPDDTWTLLARAYLQRNLALLPEKRERDWKELDDALAVAAAVASQAVPALLLRADAFVARDQPADADALLAKACTDLPTRPELWAARARLAARSGSFSRARDILAEGRAKTGDCVELRLAVLECWPGDDPAKARVFLHEQEAGLEQFADADRGRLQAALVGAYYRCGHFADGNRLARSLLTDLTSKQTSPAFSEWIRLLDLVLEGTDDGLIDEVVLALRRLEIGKSESEDGPGIWWRYGTAAHHVIKAKRGERAALEAARAALRDVAEHRPGWGRAVLLQAFLDDLAGDGGKALDGYLRAFDLGERSLPVVQRLVALLAERGRYAEADIVLAKAQQQLLPRGDFARLGAEVALRLPFRLGKTERALSLAHLAVPEGTTDPARLLWLGQVYAAVGQIQEADKIFQRVIDLAYDAEKKSWRYDPIDAWMTLVAHRVRNEQVEAAEEAVEDMRRRLPPDQQPFALGVCYEALGRYEKAEEDYLAALEKSPNEALVLQRLATLYIRWNQPEKAEPHLLTLFRPSVVAPAANLRWARRQEALILADRGEKDYGSALRLLEENTVKGRPALADQRALAFIQATRPENRDAALKSLEESRELQPLAPDELFRLARFYEAQENGWPRARVLMKELLDADFANTAYLAYHIQNLLKHDGRKEAKGLVDRLNRLEPGSPRVKAFQAELNSVDR